MSFRKPVGCLKRFKTLPKQQLSFMLRIIIVEDDVLTAEHLSDILKKYGHKIVGICHNKKDGLLMINELLPDMAILDISMEKKLDGIEIAEYMKANLNIPFVYITAQSDRAIIEHALETKPSAYILKPFKSVEVFTAVSIAHEKFESKVLPSTIAIKDNYKTYRINTDDILYMEAEGVYIKIVTKIKTHLERTNFDDLMERLDAATFIRVHRSFCINIRHATEIKSNTVVVAGNQIPISRTYLKELRSQFFENQ